MKYFLFIFSLIITSNCTSKISSIKTDNECGFVQNPNIFLDTLELLKKEYYSLKNSKNEFEMLYFWWGEGSIHNHYAIRLILNQNKCTAYRVQRGITQSKKLNKKDILFFQQNSNKIVEGDYVQHCSQKPHMLHSGVRLTFIKKEDKIVFSYLSMDGHDIYILGEDFKEKLGNNYKLMQRIEMLPW